MRRSLRGMSVSWQTLMFVAFAFVQNPRWATMRLVHALSTVRLALSMAFCAERIALSALRRSVAVGPCFAFARFASAVVSCVWAFSPLVRGDDGGLRAHQVDGLGRLAARPASAARS
jgi:hypothetical protein